MQITVIGAGYVGLVSAVCFACSGHQVICLEKDAERCKMLMNGQCPIFEKDLPEMLCRALDEGKIKFTTQAQEAISSADIIFIAVGTPSGADGQADLSELFVAISEIGKFLQNDTLVVIKSTVPPGTTDAVQNRLLKTMNGVDHINVIFNPEFLREGTAVDDFLSPDRVVVGSNDWRDGEVLLSLYRPLLRKPVPEIHTSPLNAELIKYASNSYLAVRLSFINELAGLCEKLGGNINEITKAMGMDQRIGNSYLSAGLGYGGACLPKDTLALVHTAKNVQTHLLVLEGAIEANRRVAHRLAKRVADIVMPGGTIAIWGLSFKAGTEDIRNSPVLSLIKELSKYSAYRFQIYDPSSEKHTDRLPEELMPLLCHTMEESLIGADALVVGTAWPQFSKSKPEHLLLHMHRDVIFDFANALDRADFERLGFEYHACGEK